MAHDVFISHSVKDKIVADAMCAMLESEGIRCWIAPRDVTPGMEWGKCIVDAIRHARIMVLVFTAHANASQQIHREVERAVHHDVIIVPFRTEDIVPDESLEYFIGNVHWLDALTPPLEAHLKKLTSTIKALLEQVQPRQEQPVPLQHVGKAASGAPRLTHLRQESEPQMPNVGEPPATAPEIPATRKLTGPVAGSGTTHRFKLWGVKAWVWAGGVLFVVLLAAVFIKIRSVSHPAPLGATPSPVGASQATEASPLSPVTAAAMSQLQFGMGVFLFGMTPEQVNAKFHEPFSNVSLNSLPVANEFSPAVIRYFWKPMSQFDPADFGFTPLSSFSECWNHNQSNVFFFFDGTQLVRIDLRLYTDCPNRIQLLNNFGKALGLNNIDMGQPIPIFLYYQNAIATGEFIPDTAAINVYLAGSPELPTETARRKTMN